jgi:hypothetical protein
MPISPHGRFIELLISVPALINLKLEGDIVVLDGLDDLPNIKLAHLESLSISDVPFEECMYTICLAMSGPALTSLELGNMTSWTTHAVTRILQQSQRQPKFPALTHLKFKSASFIELNNAFINALPTITHISLSSCPFSYELLEFVAEFESESDDNFAWPNLQKLTIIPFGPAYIEPLCVLVAARIRIGLPLHTIVLSENDVDAFRKIEFLRDNMLVELIPDVVF